MSRKQKSSARSVSKSKVRIPIQKGALALNDKDYHIKNSITARRKILNGIITEHGDAINVFRALLARRTLGKNRLSPTQIETLTKDMAYIKKKYYGTALWSAKKKKKSSSYEDSDDNDGESSSSSSDSENYPDEDEDSGEE